MQRICNEVPLGHAFISTSCPSGTELIEIKTMLVYFIVSLLFQSEMERIIQLLLSIAGLGELQNLIPSKQAYVSSNLRIVNTLKMCHNVLQISNQGGNSRFHLLVFRRWRREV